MNGSVTFSRNLNLLIKNDLSTFFQELAKASYPLPVRTEDELNRLVYFAREFFPDSALAISAGMTPIDERLIAMIRRGQAKAFLENTLPIIMFLYAFKEDHHFIQKMKTRLTNPSQFGDTLFELKCLEHFHKNGFAFKYEPKIFDEGKEKNPDFRLTKNNIELFCECKQVRIGQNKADLEFDRQCAGVRDKFPKGIEKQLFDKKLRLEVNFKKNLAQIAPREIDGLAALLGRLTGSANGITTLPLQQLGNSIEYLVIPQDEPSPFPIEGRARMLSFNVTLGQPFRIGNLASPGGEITFISADLASRKARVITSIITEARYQLPKKVPSIVILSRANLTIVERVIKRRVNRKEYNTIIAFVVNPFEEFWRCYRTGYREILFDLFEGFLPENPFSESEQDSEKLKC